MAKQDNTFVIKKLVTQTGNDTFTTLSLDTNIGLDSKKAWQINAIEAYWVDGLSAAAGDWTLAAILSTVSTATSFVDDSEIARVCWGLQNTGGVAVAVPYEPLKDVVLMESRITVAPLLYLGIQSTGTGQANDIVFRIYGEIVPITETELLKNRNMGI